MFPFKKKIQPVDPVKPAEPKKETLHEQVRRRFDETDTRLGEAVRKMEERFAARQLQPIPVKVRR